MAQHNKRQPGPIRRTLIDQTSNQPSNQPSGTRNLHRAPSVAIRLSGYVRPTRARGAGPNEWATVSQNYSTAATVDRRWDATVSQVSR